MADGLDYGQCLHAINIMCMRVHCTLKERLRFALLTLNAQAR